MQRNLFIILSVNVIGVRTDKGICGTYYSHVFGCRRLEEIAQICAEGAHEEKSNSCCDFAIHHSRNISQIFYRKLLNDCRAIITGHFIKVVVAYSLTF